MNKEELYEDLGDVIDFMEEEDLLKLLNEYGSKVYDKYSEIYEFNEFTIDKLLYGFSPSEVLNATIEVNFSDDEYVTKDTHGNLESIDLYDCSEDEMSNIIEYIIDNGEDFGNDEISKLLESYEV